MKKQPIKKHSAKSGAKKTSASRNEIFVTLVITAALVISGVIAMVLLKQPNKQKSTAGTPTATQQNMTSDLVIPISGISENASFYPVTVDGTQLEVLAVKASDGTIRTAFNTCQVCYDSGRGYYKQSGNVLVCQNCGNSFKMSDVEVAKGGCNPVPIYAENKTVSETTITISSDFLKETTQIFLNWKTN